MKPKRITFLFLSVTLLITVYARLFQFPSIPPSLNRDEAALGYNAYALVTAGIDEWGQPWPLIFKSFGDFKLPGYIYTLVPFIAVFDLSVFVTRLPSLVAGFANLYLVYRLAQALFPDKKLVPPITLAVAALMPWAIFYSRMAYEANLSLSFFLLTLWLLSSEKQPQKILLAPITFSLSLATYNAPLILAPALIGALLIAYVKKGHPHKKHLILSTTAILGITIVAAIVFRPINQAKTGVAVFSDPTIQTRYQEVRGAIDPNLLSRVWYQKHFYYSRLIIRNHLSHLSPQFLVMEGGEHPWHTIPGYGHLSWSQYLMMVGGLILLVIKRRKTPVQMFMVLVLLTAPLASTVTIGAPHTTRSLPWLMLAAIPIGYAVSVLLKHSKYTKIIAIIVMLMMVVETTHYLKQYMVNFPQETAKNWMVGLREAIKKLPQTGEVYFTQYADSPYIYLLFHQQIHPNKFRQSVDYYPPDSAGLIHVRSFDRYHFVATIDQVPEGETLVVPKTNQTYEITQK